MNNILKIGTSGYSFDDWTGNFYPENIQKGKRLDYYSKFFNTVEINSTYYNIPNRSVFYHISNKTQEDFEFIVKLNQQTTHKRENGIEAINNLKESAAPLIESGKLKGFLAQFPWSFKHTSDAYEYLLLIKNKCDKIPIFMEFRNISWVNDKTYQFMRENEIGYCCVDEPKLKGLIHPQSISTTDIAYVRFHGRNSLNWWDQTKGDRYDYLYKEKELAEWLEKVRELRKNTKKTYLFFNNCHQGHAVKNAKMLIEMLKGQIEISENKKKCRRKKINILGTIEFCIGNGQ